MKNAYAGGRGVEDLEDGVGGKDGTTNDHGRAKDACWANDGTSTLRWWGWGVGTVAGSVTSWDWVAGSGRREGSSGRGSNLCGSNLSGGHGGDASNHSSNSEDDSGGTHFGFV